MIRKTSHKDLGERGVFLCRVHHFFFLFFLAGGLKRFSLFEVSEMKQSAAFGSVGTETVRRGQAAPPEM